MKKWLLLFILLFLTAMPVKALEITPPTPPQSAEDFMPPETQSFGEGLLYVLRKGAETFLPEISKATRVCAKVVCISILVMLSKSLPGTTKETVEMIGVVGVGVMLLSATGTLIGDAQATVREMSDYGKLLLPVMTTSLAAQGGTVSSTALYTGTAVFNALLSSLIYYILVPVVYVFLFLSVAGGALGNDMMKRIRDTIKGLAVWCLKTLLYIFTGYMSITGVISGTADHTAMKATKLTISGTVPVVGGILSDASEAVLVGAGIVKNSAGIYGLLAILAICVGPFVKIGVQYLLLKLSASLCAAFGGSGIQSVIEDFSTAMGFLLAMTGTVCLLLIISTVCFMKGLG